ncbi:MAG: RNA polymerase sigma factor [Gaiellales bacterium]
MRDARDAEDALLLQNGDHAALMAAYHPVIVQRCLVRVRSDAGHDVAQTVLERLYRELARGKRYSVPYRVVVHKVIDWTVKDYFQGRSTEIELPEGWDVADETDPYRPLEDDQVLEDLFAPLPEGARRVLELRYREGLELEEIAVRLDLKRNAVDQALHRGHARLRESIGAG